MNLNIPEIPAGYNGVYDIIYRGYKVIFEGANDVNVIGILSDIVDRIHKGLIDTLKNTSLNNGIMYTDFGFQYTSHENLPFGKNIPLTIICAMSNDDKNQFLPDKFGYMNSVIVLMCPQFDKSPDSINQIFMDVNFRNNMMHELRHWYDHAREHIHKHSITRLSQIELYPSFANALKRIKSMIVSTDEVDDNGRPVDINNPWYFDLNGFQPHLYINNQHEISANTTATIDRLISDWCRETSGIPAGRHKMPLEQYIPSNFFDQSIRKEDEPPLITNDTKRRYAKRIAVIYDALHRLKPMVDVTHPNVIKELKEYFLGT